VNGNLENVESGGHGVIYGTLSTSGWRDIGKAARNSVRIVCLRIRILKSDFLNSKKDISTGIFGHMSYHVIRLYKLHATVLVVIQ
jgi:hypothetical protein